MKGTGIGVGLGREEWGALVTGRGTGKGALGMGKRALCTRKALCAGRGVLCTGRGALDFVAVAVVAVVGANGGGTFSF
jgi:hypothetical protein